MPYSVSADEQTLIEFWDQTFSSQVKDQSSIDPKAPDSDRNLAPSDQLFQAAASLGRKKKVLDYGCGRAWAWSGSTARICLRRESMGSKMLRSVGETGCSFP